MDLDEALKSVPLTLIRPVVISVPTTVSTNTLARDLLSHGEGREGLIVIAESQSGGRGRGKRTWHSPGGGLYMSVVLRPLPTVERAPVLSLLAGVSVAQAVEQISGVHPLLKWPNDIQLWERKLGGILSDLVTEPQPLVIVGIGVNVNTPSAMFPPGIRETSISLIDVTHHQHDIVKLAATVIRQMDLLLSKIISPGGTDGVLELWRQRSATLGRRVRVSLSSGEMEGMAIDVDSSGSLIVQLDDGSLRSISAGEVIHLRT